jgi:ABC-type transport system substrate-binding protein
MRSITFALLLCMLLGLGACGDDAGELTIVLTHGNNSRPYLPWPAEVAKQVAGDLEDVGFEVEIEMLPWSTYIPYVERGKHQIALLGWSADVPDTDNFLSALLHEDSAVIGRANNISFYRSKEVSGLIDQARLTHDETERDRLYGEAQRLIFRDVPMVPLVYTDRMIAHRKAFGPLAVEWITHPQLRLVETPVDGDLVFLRGSDSNKLDPGDVTDGESSKVIEQVYDTLTRYVPGTIEIEPGLATSWTSSEDHKVWTFEIREGVTFHDGTALDGAAVVDTFERMRDPEHQFHFPDGKWANWTGLFGFVDQVKLGDHPMQVVFVCNEPAPPFFLKQLAMFTCSIISPAALEKHGPQIRRNPVGTGPFKFVEWNNDVEIRLTRNDDYWDGAPALKSLSFRISNNATVRSTRLLAGSGADLIDNLDPATIPALEADGGVAIARRPQSSLCYVSMNNLEPPFDNPKVREAVAYAINKERIIQMAYKGYAKPATVPVPPGFNGYAADLEDRPYDPEKAKALLREAGYDVK